MATVHRSAIARLLILFVASCWLALPAVASETEAESAAGNAASRVVAPPGTGVGLPFSPGVLGDDLLFLAGAIGNEPGVAAVEGDAEAQTAQALDNLEAVLEAAGLDPSRIVATTVYVSDGRRYPQIGRVLRDRAAGAVPPTRSVVEADIAIPDAALEVSAVAARPGVEVEAVQPEGWPRTTNRYSWGVRAGDSLFIAGQAGIDPTTGARVADFPGQVRQTLANIDAVVTAGGFARGDLVACRVFLADARDFAAMNEEWRAFFEGLAAPTRATVRARSLDPSLRVQIECQARRGAERRVVKLGDGPVTTPFSPAIQVGDKLYLSGFVGRGPDGYPAGVAAQTRLVLDRLGAHLEAAGMSFADVVDATVWLSDVRFYAAMNEVYGAAMPVPPPARATVGTQLMSPDALVEIAMIAERRGAAPETGTEP